MKVDNLQGMLDSLVKFKQAGEFHKKLFKQYAEGGRSLTFLSVNTRDNVEITWGDIETIGKVFDLLNLITSEDRWQKL